jgi:site-specific DNA recombinase
MKRAAIYARYSTDLQNERSADDQIALCRDYATRNDLTVVDTYADRGISGASTINRPGIRQLLTDAKAGKFDVLLAEDFARIGRDVEDLAGMFKRLQFVGVGIETVHSGRADVMSVGMHGLMAQSQRESIAKNVHRGLSTVVRSGRHAGGRAYGYRPIYGPERGNLEIVESEADIVRRIFRLYADGVTPRAIAWMLNAEGLAPPRGKRWSASTINGNTKRGAGILQNELYIGRIVWNKVRMVKNPDTARRLSRPNDGGHMHADAPHLRIVDDETWAAVRARKRANAKVVFYTQRRPRLLTGLIRCGACGGGMTSIGKGRKGSRIQCSAFRESGTCDNNRTVWREDVERETLAGLVEHLRHPDVIGDALAEYNSERARLTKSEGLDRAAVERRLAEIERDLERIADAIIEGVAVSTLKAKAGALETERDALRFRLVSIEHGAVEIRPAALDRYLDAVDSLAEIANDDDADELRALTRQLIRSVTVYFPARDRVSIAVKGDLSQLSTVPVMGAPKVVAEEGLEPPTHGL